MAELVKQPGFGPTRKVWAVFIATFVVQGFLAALDNFFPGIADVLPAEQWISNMAAFLPVMAAYMTHERA